MLVRMLRTEIGEVYNRAAWGDSVLLTPDIRQLYKEPLRIQGWDAAILEVFSTIDSAYATECRSPSLAQQQCRHALGRALCCCCFTAGQPKHGRSAGGRLCEYFGMVQDLPALVVTGARDR